MYCVLWWHFNLLKTTFRSQFKSSSVRCLLGTIHNVFVARTFRPRVRTSSESRSSKPHTCLHYETVRRVLHAPRWKCTRKWFNIAHVRRRSLMMSVLVDAQGRCDGARYGGPEDVYPDVHEHHLHIYAAFLAALADDDSPWIVTGILEWWGRRRDGCAHFFGRMSRLLENTDAASRRSVEAERVEHEVTPGDTRRRGRW